MINNIYFVGYRIFVYLNPSSQQHHFCIIIKIKITMIELGGDKPSNFDDSFSQVK
jgi:hypothetical protein